jgi:hypothetical protein
MGWETRRGVKYYYRKERDPQTGRVRSLYCGGGERGEQAAREDEARRRSTTVDVLNIQHVKKEPDVLNIQDVKKAVATSREDKKEADVADIRTHKKEGESGLMVRAASFEKKVSRFMHAPSQPVPDESIPTEPQEPPLTHDEIVSRARSPAFVPLVRANLAARSFQTALVFTSITGEEFERRGLAD